MDHARAVLVLSSEARSDLVESLFNIGFVPLRRDEMMPALAKIRHEQIAAVIVDGDHSDVDTLEFILNVRDIDARIRIVVMGKSVSEPERRALSKQENIALVSKDSNCVTIDQLKTILNIQDQ